MLHSIEQNIAKNIIRALWVLSFALSVFAFYLIVAPQPAQAQSGVGEAACRDAYEKGSGGTSSVYTLGWQVDHSTGNRPACGDAIEEENARLAIFEWESGRQSTVRKYFEYWGVVDSGFHAFTFIGLDPEESSPNNVILLNESLRAVGPGDEAGYTLHDPLGVSNTISFASTGDGELPDQLPDFQQETGEERDPTCEDIGGGLTWLACPVVTSLNWALNFITDRIDSLLRVPLVYFEAPTEESDAPIEGAWRALRNFAFIILVPMALLMVISTALGFELFSAYTVKKALPRLVAAAIFIALSWEIVVFIIGLVNTLGAGIAGIILNPIGGFENAQMQDFLTLGGDAWLGAFGLIGVTGAIAATAIGGLPVVLMTLAIVVLFLMTVFALLLLREIIVIALAIFAPIAILAWIFPANTKIWTMWRVSFIKLLLLYPLIMLLIATGRLLASIVSHGGTFEGPTGFQQTVIILFMFVGPYFFIPTAFKFAGGAFANLAGMVNNKEKGLFDRTRNARAGIMKKRTGDALQGKRWSNQGKIGRGLNKLGQTAGQAPKMGVRPSRWRGNVAAGREASDMKQMQDVLQHPDAAPIINDDDMLSVAIDASKNGWTRKQIQDKIAADMGDRFTTEQSRSQATATIENFLKTGSQRSVAGAAIAAKAGTKTGYLHDPDSGQFGMADTVEDILSISGGDTGFERSVIAAAKGNFGNAKRYDQAGAGFGTILDVVKDLQSGDVTKAEAANKIVDASLKEQGPGAIIAGPEKSTKPLLEAQKRRIDKLWREYQQAPQNEDAKKNFVRSIAEAESLVDMASQASPASAELASETVLSHKPDGQTTVRELNNQLAAAPETKDEYSRMRRVYDSQIYQDAERLRQSGAATQPTLPIDPNMGPQI